MPKAPETTPAPPIPTALETWRYIRLYLGVATAIAATVACGALVAGLSARADAQRGRALLESEPLDVRAAFDVLSPTRLFGGRKQSDDLLPTTDALHSRFGPTEEEALADAFNATDVIPPAGASATPPERCQDPVCLVVSLSRPQRDDGRALSPRLRAFAYFLARRAMHRAASDGEVLLPMAERVLTRYPSLWIRAFERQVKNKGGTPTNAAPILLATLQAEVESAARGALVFAGYAWLVTLIFGLALGVWWRWRRPEAA